MMPAIASDETATRKSLIRLMMRYVSSPTLLRQHDLKRVPLPRLITACKALAEVNRDRQRLQREESRLYRPRSQSGWFDDNVQSVF